MVGVVAMTVVGLTLMNTCCEGHAVTFVIAGVAMVVAITVVGITLMKVDDATASTAGGHAFVLRV